MTRKNPGTAARLIALTLLLSAQALLLAHEQAHPAELANSPCVLCPVAHHLDAAAVDSGTDPAATPAPSTRYALSGPGVPAVSRVAVHARDPPVIL